MNQAEVEAFLTQRGIAYEVKDQEHCVQVRAKGGEVVNFFKTGTVQVQGKKTPLHAELKAWSATGEPVLSGATPTGIQPSPGPNKNVFVVYGHDNIARDGLELLLRKMGLKPIILANLPAAGDTIIEKLERYLHQAGDVGYACVLLTPDDMGHVKSAPGSSQGRARQNVILELGMVLANLGRKRVAILYQEDVEKPSDIQGLLYLPFKVQVEEIKAKLFKELQAAGYTPDPEAL
ncbi:TIR domain-containing protein [Micropruina sonneratiae]|uniref:TIR domain-containing protein n=1 Tax=Micropruina sonneratiae TaxID=2986940 RepID=UPI0022279A87|nr:TIR domain-containing protein [Micropruina sp. KQZ13P-5]MCW3159595.1 nucleotide-binding protein [Micropruina sp. KQZ13P-5]